MKDEQSQKMLLDSLYRMYMQYCSKGHLFMQAGELASGLLEAHGYIETDGTGKVVKDHYDYGYNTSKEENN